MSINSGGSKQLPMLLQQSKLPPINELLKTSVGLIRPVNLAPSAAPSTLAQAPAPQPLFRYPYGMPLQRPGGMVNPPLIQVPHSKPVYNMPGQQPLRVPQQPLSINSSASNGASSEASNCLKPLPGSRIIVVQEQARPNPVVIVHPQTSGATAQQPPLDSSSSGESFTITSNSVSGANSVVPLGLSDLNSQAAEASKKARPKKPRKASPSQNAPKRTNSSSPSSASNLKKKRVKRVRSNRASPSVLVALKESLKKVEPGEVGEVDKLRKEVGNVKRGEFILKAELKNVRGKLLDEIKMHDADRSKHDATATAMRQELAQLRKRVHGAEAQVASLQKKNAQLSKEVVSMKTLHGIDTVSDLLDQSADDLEDGLASSASLPSEQSKQLVESLEMLLSSLDESNQNFGQVRANARRAIAFLSGSECVSPSFKVVDGLQVSSTVFDTYRQQTGRVLRSNVKRSLATVEETLEDALEQAESENYDQVPSMEMMQQCVDVVDLKLFCPQCGDFSSTSLKSLLIHMGRKHHFKHDAISQTCKRNMPAKCVYCPETAKDYLQLAVHCLRDHFAVKAERSPFNCQMVECRFSALEQWDLIIHLACGHLMPVELLAAAKAEAASASSRFASVLPSSLLCICKHCPYRTERYTDMRKHALRRHGDETAFERREATEADPEVTVPCGVCSSRFFRPGDLKRHRARYNHYLGVDIKGEPAESTDSEEMPLRRLKKPHFLAPKLNLAARVYARAIRRLYLVKRRKRIRLLSHSLESELSAKHMPLISHFEVDEVTDLFNEAPPSPDLALLISNSDIKTLCDFPGDVEKLLGD